MGLSFTPAEKVKLENRKVRRRRERKRREDEYRRRIERLRRQIAEARKCRQRLLLMLLLAVLAILESMRPRFPLPVDWPEPTLPDWAPSSKNDFSPNSHCDDYCDGYSHEQWDRMTRKRGIKLSRKAELQEAWKADPSREHFPDRYQQWNYRPFLGEIMNDLAETRWQADALAALKLMSPPETHQYLDEAFATDLADLRRCNAATGKEIAANFQRSAARWEISKQKEAQEMRRENEQSLQRGAISSFPS